MRPLVSLIEDRGPPLTRRSCSGRAMAVESVRLVRLRQRSVPDGLEWILACRLRKGMLAG
jgi:hypothetical protein